MRTVEIDGKSYLWRDLLRLRREQKKAQKHAQLELFELKEDCRPETQRSAEGRYSQPLLFKN
jgi:hypothetical protein